MVWGMSYDLNGFGYEVWFECFVVLAMIEMVWHMSRGLNSLAYEAWSGWFCV